MNKETKEKTYQEVYQQFKQESAVTKLEYPEHRDNYDFSCNVGTALVKFSLNASTDMFSIRAEKEFPRLNHKELVQLGKKITHEKEVRFSAYDHKLTLIHTLPMPDMSDEMAANEIKRISKEFIEIVKIDFNVDEPSENQKETVTMDDMFQMFTKEDELRQPVKSNKQFMEKVKKRDDQDREKEVASFAKKVISVEKEKSETTKKKEIKNTDEENNPSMYELYEKYKYSPDVRMKMQEMYADMDRVYVSQTNRIKFANDNLKRRESILKHNQECFDKEKAIHAAEYEEFTNKIKRLDEETLRLNDERRAIEFREKQIIAEKQTVIEMNKAIDERIRLVEMMEAEHMPGISNQMEADYEARIENLQNELKLVSKDIERYKNEQIALNADMEKLKEKNNVYLNQLSIKEDKIKELADALEMSQLEVRQLSKEKEDLRISQATSNKTQIKNKKTDHKKILEDVQQLCETIGNDSMVDMSFGMDGVMISGMINSLPILINPKRELIRISKNIKRATKETDAKLLKFNSECDRELFYYEDKYKKTIVCRAVLSGDIKKHITTILDYFTEL